MGDHSRVGRGCYFPNIQYTVHIVKSPEAEKRPQKTYFCVKHVTHLAPALLLCLLISCWFELLGAGAPTQQRHLIVLFARVGQRAHRLTGLAMQILRCQTDKFKGRGG